MTLKSFLWISWFVLGYAENVLGQFVPIRDIDAVGATLIERPNRIRRGIAAGSALDASSSKSVAAVWNAQGTTVLAPLAGDVLAEALDVAEDGTAVGDSGRFGFAERATLWRAGVATDLSTLVTGGAALDLWSARAIDANGRIAGWGGDPVSSAGRGFLFDAGIVTELAPLAAGQSWAYAMNDRGQVIGHSDSSTGYNHATLWDGSGAHDLHTAEMGHFSQAFDVDRHGRVVGYYGIVFGSIVTWYAYFLDQGIVTTFDQNTIGLGMNDFGVAVGTASASNHALLFEKGKTIDLDTLIDPALGWHLEVANDIDNERRIVGHGKQNGVESGFILEPLCDGSFSIYGTGCPGGNGVEPRLLGQGCLSPKQDFALEFDFGAPGAFGLLLIGSGTGSAPVTPVCDAQVLPLVFPLQVLLLDAFGQQWIPARLPVGTPAFDLNLQALWVDPGAAYGISATQPLSMHFR